MKKYRVKKATKLKRGMVVVWDHHALNPKHWKKLTEEERIRQYGALGYGDKRPKLFVFLCRIKDQQVGDTGHCVLVSLSDQKIETMRHTNEFRQATEEEF